MTPPPPGVNGYNLREPAKLATDGSRSSKNRQSKLCFLRIICRPLRGLGRELVRSPGSASPSPGASTLSARFADWLDDFFQPTIGCGFLISPADPEYAPIIVTNNFSVAAQKPEGSI